MFNYFRKFTISFLVLVTFIFYFVASNSFSGVLDSWRHERAYKPKPILFLHGFAEGGPTGWDSTKKALDKYFSEYNSIYPYLEIMDFQDPNGSIDTYDAGKVNPQGNSKGWADKLNDKINELLSHDKYGAYANQLNLVAHSMGGLAARWYLVKYSRDTVDKLILIGVPNKGSRLAELANAASNVPKVGWLDLLTINGFISTTRIGVNSAVKELKEIDVYGEAVDDMNPSPSGSSFLGDLNSHKQPENVDYYGVIGIAGSFMNRYISEDKYYGGDSVVSQDSQSGTNIISYKESVLIEASHGEEIEVASKGEFSPILYFLDSDKPEIEITAPDIGKTVELYGPTLQLQGKVYKEYLPADAKLIIDVSQIDGSYNPPPEERSLKAPDLWRPNAPETPVAEFDEVINFPGKGTYRVYCKIKNPVGITSDSKELTVKVNVLEGTYIIVHAHNEEGKEIASIKGMPQDSVLIYDGDALIGAGAYNADTHNRPIKISSGTHTIKAVFNGMTEEKTIVLDPNETEMVIFIFKRENYVDEVKSKLAKTFTRTLAASDLVSGKGRWVDLSDDSCWISSYFYTWYCSANASVEFQIESSLLENKLHLEGHLINGTSYVWNKNRDVFFGWGVKVYAIHLNGVRWDNVIELPSTCTQWFVQGKEYSWSANNSYLHLRLSTDASIVAVFGISPSSDELSYYLTSIPPGIYGIDTGFLDIADFAYYSRTGYENDEEGSEDLVDFALNKVFELETFLSNVPYDLTGDAVGTGSIEEGESE